MKRDICRGVGIPKSLLTRLIPVIKKRKISARLEQNLKAFLHGKHRDSDKLRLFNAVLRARRAGYPIHLDRAQTVSALEQASSVTGKSEYRLWEVYREMK